MLREVARDPFLRYISREYAVQAVTTLHLCQAHMSVLLGSNGAYSVQEILKPSQRNQ